MIYIYTQYTKLECYWTFSKSWCHTSDSLVPSSSMLDKHSKLGNMMHQCTSKALKLSVKWQLDSMIAYIFPGVEVVANFDNTRGQGRSNVTRCTASICVTPTCGCNRRSKIHLLAEKKNLKVISPSETIDATRRQTSCPPSLKAVKALVCR